MKNHFTKKLLPFVSICLFSFATLTITSCSDSNDNNEHMVSMNTDELPPLIERQGELAKAVEWQKTKDKVAELMNKIANNPSDTKSRLQLATIYILEARITGDSYYHQATIKILDQVLAKEPNNFEANVYKASVAMSLHQFEEARKIAEKAVQINPDNAYVYGVLVDANVELGNYAEAIAMSDKMQVLKPSLESYSRASYLREIYGDYNGAIYAMQMAVNAGAAGSESAEWARVTLGDLYLNTGKLDSAKIEYETTLAVRPQFPNAEIGLAKVCKYKKDYTAAIKHTENAIRMVSETSYVSMLGELYKLSGNNEKATEIQKEVVSLLEENEKKQGIVLMPHNANRELANAYINNNELDEALKYAKDDLALRPANIDANELMAWVLYLKGDYQNASGYADKMLATNTQNAATLYKASLIYAKTGQQAKASSLAQRASSVNPFVNQKALLASR